MPYPRLAVGYTTAVLLLFALLAALSPVKHRHDNSRQSMRSSFVESGRSARSAR